MNVQLQEQKKINVEILGELRSLKELLLSDRNPHLGLAKWPQPKASALEIRNSSTFQINSVPHLEIPFPASASASSYRPGESHTNRGEVSIILILLGIFILTWNLCISWTALNHVDKVRFMVTWRTRSVFY